MTEKCNRCEEGKEKEFPGLDKAAAKATIDPLDRFKGKLRHKITEITEKMLDDLCGVLFDKEATNKFIDLMLTQHGEAIRSEDNRRLKEENEHLRKLLNERR